MNEYEFKIEGMSCNHCVMGVESELREAGFENFKVEIGSANVKYDGSAKDEIKIKTVIEEAGYKVIQSN